MTDGQKHQSDNLVSPYHTPKHTEPHEGFHHTRFEGTDATVKLIVVSLGIIVLTLIVAAIVSVPIHKGIRDATPAGTPLSRVAPERVVPPYPQLEVHPWMTLPDVRRHEEDVLNGKIPDADGHVRVPIDQAMNMVVSQLNVRPNAPAGITTPGGEGRAFAGSVNNMPPAYQRPQIQGEIRKHAEK